MDFRAFLRALRGFEDAEADLLDQAGVMVIRGYIGVGWVAATKPDEMEKLEQQEIQLFCCYFLITLRIIQTIFFTYIQ